MERERWKENEGCEGCVVPATWLRIALLVFSLGFVCFCGVLWTAAQRLSGCKHARMWRLRCRVGFSKCDTASCGVNFTLS